MQKEEKATPQLEKIIAKAEADFAKGNYFTINPNNEEELDKLFN